MSVVNEKRKLILIGVAAALAIAAGVVFLTSGSAPTATAPEPALQQAGAIEKSVREAAQQAPPPPQDFERKTTRGAVAP
jgi:hypothetical protein